MVEFKVAQFFTKVARKKVDAAVFTLIVTFFKYIAKTQQIFELLL